MKTSLAPGSMVVTDYLERAGLTQPLDELGFNLVGYGCTTCIGNSGPLPDEISAAVNEHDLAVAAVLSGNRNFEGRINQDVKLNYLASPPLVVAYAIAGTMDIDLTRDPLGTDTAGEPVYLRDIWPSAEEIAETIAVRRSGGHVPQALRRGLRRRRALARPRDPERRPLRLGRGLDLCPPPAVPRRPQAGARPAVGHRGRARPRAARRLGHDRPHLPGRVDQARQPGRTLPPGARRRARGVQLLWRTAWQSRGPDARHLRQHPPAQPPRRGRTGRPSPKAATPTTSPTASSSPIYDAAMRYQQEGVPLIVIGGKEYGSGSSRDWAAKGSLLLGIRAVIAESFERIHRSNLVGMGVLPLQFQDEQGAASLGLSGNETFSITGVAEPLAAGELPKIAKVTADEAQFEVRVRIDTPMEATYFRHGGILPYVVRRAVAHSG